MQYPQERDWRIVYAVAVLLLFGLYLFTLRAVLSPFVLFFVLAAALAPFAGQPAHRTLLIVCAALLMLWLLSAMGSVLAPFVLAFILAYILSPAVDALQRRGMKRGLAIGALALPVLALIAAAVLLGIPALIDQVETVARNTPRAVERLVEWFNATRQRFDRIRLPFMDDRPLGQQYTLDVQRVTAFIQQRQNEILGRLWSGVIGVGRGVGLVLGVLGYVVLVPVLTFYLLRDWHGVRDRLITLAPEPRRASWLQFFSEFDQLLSRFLRGQMLAAAIVGVLTWIGLLVLGFPYAGVVAVVAGVFNLVPYLGLIVSAIPAVIIALFSGDIGASLLKALIVFGVVQFIDGSITGPRIVGSSVGLHPVWVILALAVGGFFFGFVGLLLAVPGAVLVKLLARIGMERYQQSELYLGASAPPA
jgi:predicted PurR-regulated permease PerM